VQHPPLREDGGDRQVTDSTVAGYLVVTSGTAAAACGSDASANCAALLPASRPNVAPDMSPVPLAYSAAQAWWMQACE
jgi:hypothetical protein